MSISRGALKPPSFPARPCINTPMAGSFRIQFIRCPTAARWPRTRISLRGRKSLKKQYEFGKQQEEALRIRNLQFDSAINNMSHGLCFFDPAHRLIVCNDRYVEMYDLPRDRIGPGTA